MSLKTVDVEKQYEQIQKQLSDLMAGVQSGGTGTVTPEKTELMQKMMNTFTVAKDSLLKTREKAKKDGKKRELQKLYDQMKNCNAVDLCFLVDCTNSMSSHIDGVKARIKRIIKRVQKTNKSLRLRAAFVGYRDVNLPKSQQLEKFDFSEDIEKFKDFVGKVQTFWGGDYAEDVSGGVHACTELDWSNDTAIVIHIGDAPCHGQRFHTMGKQGDTYYRDGCPRGYDIVDEVQSLVVRDGMSYYFLRIHSLTDKMITEINKELPPELQVQVLDYESVEKLEDLVTTCVRSSIFRTFTATKGGEGPEKDLELSSDVWNADDLPQQTATLSIAPRKKNLSEIMSPTRFVRGTAASASVSVATAADTKSVEVKIAPQPFAKGALRYCFQGFMKVNHIWEEYVFKEFKSIRDEDNSKKSHECQADESAVAVFLAEAFNASSGSGPKVFYKRAYIAEVEVVGPEGKQVKRYTVERRLLDGEFQKFCSNVAIWDGGNFHPTLGKFLKYTHEATNGHMMVCDLQGVIKKGRDGEIKAFHLTDPAIHCVDSDRFAGSRTSLGEEAMGDFLEATDSQMEQWLEEHNRGLPFSRTPAFGMALPSKGLSFLASLHNHRQSTLLGGS
uniref:Alpha-type protein kinase domain-containing protein n=1 Tax=Chromera velia CCMP2878 TaxID=1169474 RepID=A0A0G4GXY8_9ALVE|eukprot:Cvel_23854.t1-p1 / transcript=Cvel_23854.t1 / gene=Cvel_23854 / organism=Chromera_velia_CCMP2878 / gene_product=Alpha-protein kinase vwkA, putative / transcript_product=Alpha-protein kinase vwkA, putative / location=Cvel_scaffold2510:1610-4643(-) / protein_length=613 / sequence_SO=supercontig / SO=protein_coding / is_pseudo=false